ncbi:unnamed protein product [Lupinus luteus]|uniref:Tf2-1-like SH3-like domain-containing protein n=1 Tax=Lupinus luteus TaxID=3873 RepID=A0AAV1WLM1_LUPLU
MSPFKVVYGRDPPKLIRYALTSAEPLAVQEQLLQRDHILAQLKIHLQRAQHIQKKNADLKRTHVEFQIGDKVLVKLQPYRQHSLTLRKNQKLSLRYFGPFTIEKMIGKVAYKLSLPENTKLHPVFHVSQLKLCHGNHVQAYIPLPMTGGNSRPVIQPVSILQRRTIIQGTQQVKQHLILWEGLDYSHAKWEDHEILMEAFPDFNLGDKVNFNGRGIVMNADSKDKEKRAKEENQQVDQGELVTQLGRGAAKNEKHTYGKILGGVSVSMYHSFVYMICWFEYVLYWKTNIHRGAETK